MVQRVILCFVLSVACLPNLACPLKDHLGFLDKKNCSFSSDIRISDTKVAVIYLRPRFYVGGEKGADWDPSQRAISGNPIPNSRLIDENIPRFLRSAQKANDVFKKNRLNLITRIDGAEPVIYADSKMIPMKLGHLSGLIDPYQFDVVFNKRRAEPRFLHVHWSWKNSYDATLGWGSHFSIVVADDPFEGDILSNWGLAHEIVHALGVGGHTSGKEDLMAPIPSGDLMTPEQIETVKLTINSPDSPLLTMSCDR